MVARFMALELGSVFLLAPEDLPTVKALPGVTGQLIAKSKFAGWLVACTFPGEPSPGVIAAVTVYTWFDLGRWNVTYVEAIPEIPLPLAVVNRNGVGHVLVNFNGDTIRAARDGELELLGRPSTCSPVRLLKACHAYAGNIDRTADLEDMTFEAYMFKAALMAESGL